MAGSDRGTEAAAGTEADDGIGVGAGSVVGRVGPRGWTGRDKWQRVLLGYRMLIDLNHLFHLTSKQY